MIKPENTKEPRQGIQVIARAATILRALEDEPQGLSLGEIAKKVGLARSTVQRIVGALANENFLTAATPRARVKLGPALVRLASSARLEIEEIARPYMQELSKLLEETVDLSLLKGNHAVFIDQVAGIQRLRAVSAIGESFPLYCTANGKSMLALMPANKRNRMIKNKMEVLTPATKTDITSLEEDIEEFSTTQVAYDIEEHTDGICAIGTSFIDPIGRIFALSIPMPTSRFNRKKKTLANLLLDTRDKIVKKLSGAHT